MSNWKSQIFLLSFSIVGFISAMSDDDISFTVLYSLIGIVIINYATLLALITQPLALGTISTNTEWFLIHR